MKCPKCGKAVKKGIINVRYKSYLGRRLTRFVWYPEEDIGRLIKGEIKLYPEGVGYFCFKCNLAIGTFFEA